MRRREVLAAAGMALAAPRIVRGEPARRLTFVPSGAGLAPLDTTWTPARVTQIHASLVFDTLYGMDDTLTPRPQMLDGRYDRAGRQALDSQATARTEVP